MIITDYLKSYINALIRSQFQFPIHLYNTSDEEVWRIGLDPTYGNCIIPPIRVHANESGERKWGIVLDGTQPNGGGIYSNQSHEAKYGISLNGKYSNACIDITSVNTDKTYHGVCVNSNYIQNLFYAQSNNNNQTYAYRAEGWPTYGIYMNIGKDGNDADKFTNTAIGLEGNFYWGITINPTYCYDGLQIVNCNSSPSRTQLGMRSAINIERSLCEYGVRTIMKNTRQVGYYGNAYNEYPDDTPLKDPNLRTQIIFKGDGFPQIGCYLNLTNSSTGVQIEGSMTYCCHLLASCTSSIYIHNQYSSSGINISRVPSPKTNYTQYSLPYIDLGSKLMIRSRTSTGDGEKPGGEELIFARFGGTREFYIDFDNEDYGFRDSVIDGQRP